MSDVTRILSAIETGDPQAATKALASLCQTLLGTNDFLYIP